jgi:diacylglycerol kinase family enzyme
VPARAHAATGPELCGLAQRIAAERPRAIVAAGGDGTINAVASAIAGTGITLGVLPLGTLNHFAKDIGIPLDVEVAAATIAAGHTTEVDVGEVNGQVFINNSSLGLYPQIVRHRETQQRRLGRGKWPALAWATLMAVHRSAFMTVRLKLDDVESVYRTTFVFIGNNEYVMEGFSIGSRERIDSGRLSLYVSHRRGRLGLILLGLRALFHRLKQANDFDALTAQSIVVETRRRALHVATDGEVLTMTTPLEYRIRPRALRVFVPAPEPAG